MPSQGGFKSVMFWGLLCAPKDLLLFPVSLSQWESGRKRKQPG